QALSRSFARQALLLEGRQDPRPKDRALAMSSTLRRLRGFHSSRAHSRTDAARRKAQKKSGVEQASVSNCERWLYPTALTPKVALSLCKAMRNPRMIVALRAGTLEKHLLGVGTRIDERASKGQTRLELVVSAVRGPIHRGAVATFL